MAGFRLNWARKLFRHILALVELLPFDGLAAIGDGIAFRVEDTETNAIEVLLHHRKLHISVHPVNEENHRDSNQHSEDFRILLLLLTAFVLLLDGEHHHVIPFRVSMGGIELSLYIIAYLRLKVNRKNPYIASKQGLAISHRPT